MEILKQPSLPTFREKPLYKISALYLQEFSLGARVSKERMNGMSEWSLQIKLYVKAPRIQKHNIIEFQRRLIDKAPAPRGIATYALLSANAESVTLTWH